MLHDMDWLGQLIDLSEQAYKPTPDQIVLAINKGERIVRPGAPTTAALPVGGVSVPALPAPAPVRAPVVPVAAPPSPEVEARRPGRRPAGAPAPASLPAAVAIPPAAAPSRRAPMAVTPPAVVNGTPWDRARVLLVATGFTTPMEITPEELETVRAQNRLAPCFGVKSEDPGDSCDPSAPECQGCRLIVPCFGINNGIEGLPAPAR